MDDQNRHQLDQDEVQVISDGSGMESEDMGVEDTLYREVQDAANTLSLLQIYDRPVDLSTLQLVMNQAADYFQNLRSNPQATRNDLLEDTFIQPLLRETVQSVFTRVCFTEWQRMADDVQLQALDACAFFGFLCGCVLSFHWQKTNGLSPMLSSAARQDLTGCLSVLAFILSPANPFLTHHRLTPLHNVQFPFLAAHPAHLEEATSAAAVIETAGKEATENPALMTLPEHANVANILNGFARSDGLAVAIEALKVPDRCSLRLLQTLLQTMAHGEPYFLQQIKTTIPEGLRAVLTYIQHGFAAAADFSALESEGGEEAIHPVYLTLSHILTACSQMAHPLNMPRQYELDVAAAQQELCLRLLHSGHFTRQLAAVKELYHIYDRAKGSDEFATLREALEAAPGAAMPGPGAALGDREPPPVEAAAEGAEAEELPTAAALGVIVPGGLPPAPSTLAMDAFTAWIRGKDVVSLVLRSNLHQSQYAEAAQRVLTQLLQRECVAESHIDLLWHLAEDATTFEDIKVNACSMLGALAPFMAPERQEVLFARVNAKGLSGSLVELSHAFRLLESMARNDTKGVLPEKVFNALSDIILRSDAPSEAAKSPTLVETLLQYAHLAQADGGGDWTRYMTIKCLEKLQMDEGALSAAYQLIQILARVVPIYYPKTPQRTAFFSEFNKNASMLTAFSIPAYTRYLQQHRQRTAAAAGGTTATAASSSLDAAAAVPPQPAAFPHDAAVATFQRLLLEVIRCGNFYVLSSQLAIFLKWAVESPPASTEAAAAWDLLVAMVMGRREVQEEDVDHFLNKALCRLNSSCISLPGWQCLTAYLAVAGGGKDVELKPMAKVYDYSDFVSINAEVDWEPWRMLLAEIALKGQAEVAPRAARMLATLVGSQARVVMPAEQHHALVQQQITEWQAVLRASIGRLCGRLPVAWHDAPPALTGSGQQQPPAEQQLARMDEAVTAAQRALNYLQWLVEKGLGRWMPARFAHGMSYKDVELRVEGQLHITPGNEASPSATAKNQPANKGFTRFHVQLPRNSYVGALRRAVGAQINRTLCAASADVAAASSSSPISITNLRLFSGGRELDSDAAQVLFTVRTPLMVVFTPNQVAGWSELSGKDREDLNAASPAEALAKDPEVYALALAVIQLQLPGDNKAGFQARQASRQLLFNLPTADAALRDVERLLMMENDGGRELLALLGASDSSGGLNVAAARYAMETLCSLVLPAHNPLDSAEAASAAELRSLQLQARLFPSGVLPALLNLATENSALGGHETAPYIHGPLLLLASAVSGELLRRRNMAQDALHQQQQQQGAAQVNDSWSCGGRGVVDQADASAAAIMARYALAMMRASLGNYSGPPPLVSWAEPLNPRGLELLRACVDAVPALVPALTSKDAGLGKLVLDMLAHCKPYLRGVAANWLRRFAEAAPEARRWAFVVVVRPLLLAEDANEDQARVATEFLSTLEAEESEMALSLLRVLVQRLLSAAGSGQPVRSTAESVTALVRRLDCHSMQESPVVVKTLMASCLFPELALYAGAKGDLPSAEEVFKFHPWVLQAARRSPGCRDACMELLVELMFHDKASWDAGCVLIDAFIGYGCDILPKQNFNYPLPALRLPGALCGLRNGGATCYMNATFQQLFMQPTVRRLVLTAPTVPEGEQEDSIFHQVQSMFASLAAGVAPWVEPRGFWRAFKDYEGRPVNIREHQDAYEFFTRLQDAVDEHLRAAGHPRAICAALGGAFAQVITVAGAPGLRSEREEEFYQVSLDVRGKRGLTESLDSYVAAELMNGENQWHCEALGKKVDAEKRTLIRRLPHTLMLHLKRFEWDYETYSRWKVKDRFEFPLRLDMRPYTVEGVADAVQQDPIARAAAARDPEDPLAALSAAASADVSDLPTAPSVASRPDAYYQYELAGIVVHSGTAFAGHYYSYIRDRDSQQWHCFDDTNVDPWDPKDVDIDCFGGRFRPDGSAQDYDRPNSAYMLVYERVQAVEEGSAFAAASEGPVAMSISPAPTADAAAAAAAGGQGQRKDSAALAALNEWHREAVARSNLQSIATTHLLGPELITFFSTLSNDIKASLQGGRSRKAQRVTMASPGAAGVGAGAEGGSGPHGGDQGLCRMASLRNGDGDELLAQAVMLCLSYFSKLVARGSEALCSELGLRKGKHLFSAITSSKSRPAMAHAVLRAATQGPDGGMFAAALVSPLHDVREITRRAISGAAAEVAATSGEAAALEAVRPLFDAVMSVLHDTYGGRRIRAYQCVSQWEDIMLLLADLCGQNEAFAALAAPHLDTLVSLGGDVVEAFWKLPLEDRLELEFPRCFLQLLSFAVRGYLPPWQSHDGDNPFCLRHHAGGGGPLPPLPQEAADFFFGERGALRRALMPGGLGCCAGRRLLQWLMWGNTVHYAEIVEDLLARINHDLYPENTLVAEIPFLTEAFVIGDDLQPTRMEDLLWGSNPGGANAASSRPGLVRMTYHAKDHRRILLIRIISLMFERQSDAFPSADVSSQQAIDGWARWAQQEVQNFCHLIKVDRDEAMQWDELSQEVPDQENLYQLEEIWETLAVIAGDEPPSIGIQETDDEPYETYEDVINAGATAALAPGFGLLPPSAMVGPPLLPPPVVTAGSGPEDFAALAAAMIDTMVDIPAPRPGGAEQADDELVAEINLADSDEQEGGGGGVQ